MKFPHVVQTDLTDAELERFRRHIDSDESGWHRRFTESIWRRHQHPSNARLSGWRSEDDQKKRLIHFYDEYGVEGRTFVLRHAYLHLALSLPAEHIDEYRASLLVIGVHADRRLVQLRARRRGLRILFIDPEAYVAPDGHPIPYPVEAPHAPRVSPLPH